MMNEPIGSTRRRSDGTSGVGVGVGGHQDVARVDVAPRGVDTRQPSPLAVTSVAGVCGWSDAPAVVGQAGQAGMEAGRVEAAAALHHEPGGERSEPISAARSSPRTTWAGEPTDVSSPASVVEVGARRARECDT